MTNSYQDLHNRHSVYIERLATHLYNEHLVSGLDEAYKTARLILLGSDNLTSLSQVNKLTSAIKSAVSPTLTSSWSSVTSELEDTAIYEAGFYRSMFNTAMAVDLALPSESKIIKVVNNSLMTLTSGNSVKSDVWSAFTKANASATVDAYTSQIRAGFSNDETLTQITKRIKTINDNLLKRNAETLVRTGMSHYANSSRETLMQANKEIVPNKYFNSVFDNRRTAICSSYSVNPVFAIDDPKAPNFPLHYGERSNWLYLIEGQTEPEGTRAAVGGKSGKEVQEAYNKRKSNLDKRRDNENIQGETSSKVKYRGKKDTNMFTPGQIKATAGEEWYRSQPLWWLESNMGKGKASLFKAGRINLDGMVDQYGKPLTLKQLIDSGV